MNSEISSILKIILFLRQSTCAWQVDNQSILRIISNSICPSFIKAIIVFTSPITTSQSLYLLLEIIYVPTGVDMINWNPKDSGD